MNLLYRVLLLLIYLSLLFSGRILAQATMTPQNRLNPELVAWITGSWSGEGAFASGRPLRARLTVRLALDSAWLVMEHRDIMSREDSMKQQLVSRPRYAASSFWGVDARTGQQQAYIFDNFQGHRLFTGTGWQNDSLVWQCQSTSAKGAVYYERFIYRKLGPGQLKMVYETSSDGLSWRMGDYLIFRKEEE